ncbi:ABC transporter ATP-binding protein [Corynebacterium sp.]|uniref:ABC transporter ATP-binding protein n=1 Tax=Corynebacterium sp. TaxID=1720 RepID=UPI0026DEE84C|nr:ABC transporter ATP-binding protein [Corynebacterium sp.]MDO5513013.1 ABC transporter ATP-binding protein [Corynebacterium sp.]
MPRPILSARDVSMVYGSGEAEVRALDGVSVDFAPGRWTSIMGQSGSGKSTLLHCLTGLATPTAGSVVLDSGTPVDLTTLSENKRAVLRRTDISLVFQDLNLVPILSVRDNITLPLRLARRKVDPQWLAELVEILEIDHRLRHLPHELSGGQQQRAAIARALISRPQVLVADEPTGSLDSVTSAAVLELFRHIVTEFGQTLLFVTHDESAAHRGDELITMRDGQIIARENLRPAGGATS